MNLIRFDHAGARSRRASLAVFAIVMFAAQIATAQSPYYGQPAPGGPLVDRRSGGVLQESYDYQRGGQQPGLISPAAESYHYGFPVSTYRWGWFGAEHYYPTVFWHHGYYDDCCRWGYRSGY